MDSLWSVSVKEFTPEHLHHHETIFTIGNGFGCTRGGFEEGFPGAKGGTFVHGVFDSAPIVVTELANAPDWLPLFVLLDGERFRMDQGEVLSYEQSLDLRQGCF
jgi:kojibiose phosphorylase